MSQPLSSSTVPPAHIPRASGPEIRAQPTRPVTMADPLRVLLAEDSPIVSQRLVALIEALGQSIRVQTAATGKDAARLFEELQPDVAVLDIALPGMNGFELLAAFKLRQPACVIV